jgi:hypothetical protein
MFAAYIIVTVVAAAANIYAATNDFIRPKWLLGNMNKLGVPESSLPILGLLKAAGALGLLIGIRVPRLGLPLLLDSRCSLSVHSLPTSERAITP